MDAAVITACVTLIGFIVVNFIAEDFRRFRNGSTVAAGLAGELGSYAAPQAQLVTIISGMLQVIEEGNRQRLPFRGIDTPKDRIFEANVASLGLLGPDLVLDIAFVYGQINGFRVGFGLVNDKHAQMGNGELAARLNGCLAMLTAVRPRGELLVQKLTLRANMPFSGWLLSHFPWWLRRPARRSY
ncbi:MAG: hypothetical protein JF607_12630 [Burkholderiales bacterium]|jgi:hypothetical protein|nr:hypothetical protein [Burkholderiales bacterium]MBW8890962.1 hypothetical protein [Burkholderiales bacterium]